MNSKTSRSGSLTGARIAVASAVLLALGTAAAPAFADGPAASPAETRIAGVSLADLNLSTPEGMKAARQRFEAMAQRVCAERAGGPSPTLRTCVDSTVASALRQLDALKVINLTARDWVTRTANVSLADLDLSTLEGARAAHERLEAMARRLCTELSRSRGMTYQPDYASCVHDTLAGAWAQANVIRAARDTRTAAAP